MEDHEKRTSLGADTAGKTDESTSTQTTSCRGDIDEAIAFVRSADAFDHPIAIDSAAQVLALEVERLREQQGRHFDVMNERNGLAKYYQTALADIESLKSERDRLREELKAWTDQSMLALGHGHGHMHVVYGDAASIQRVRDDHAELHELKKQLAALERKP